MASTLVFTASHRKVAEVAVTSTVGSSSKFPGVTKGTVKTDFKDDENAN